MALQGTSLPGSLFYSPAQPYADRVRRQAEQKGLPAKEKAGQPVVQVKLELFASCGAAVFKLSFMAILLSL